MHLEILLIGEHTNHHYEDRYGIDPLTSSVTLLSDGNVHVLFDTGSLSHQHKVIEGLTTQNLKPEDITHVLLTHDHLDHTCNCCLFKNAEVHVSRAFINHKTGASTIFADMQKKPLPLSIQVIATPGHTADHVSYFFNYEGQRYCIAGDAVREDTVRNGCITPYFTPERAKQFKDSVKYIFENSDVIIPGHFRVIDGELKKYLEKFL